MKDKVNSHFAVLLIVIAGAAAAWFIVHIANSKILPATVDSSEDEYAALKESILEQ